jgi:CHAT domain-containing protein
MSDSLLGDEAAAGELFREALDARRRILGPEHPHTLASMNSLATVLAELGDLAAARDLLAQALKTGTGALGPDHPSIAAIAENLGKVHDRLGSPEEAVFYLKLSVRSAERDRADLSWMEPELRRSRLAATEERYRLLNDVLLRLGRTAEAMAILELLNEGKPRQPSPDGSPEGAARDLFAGTPEEAAWKRYSGAAEPLAALGLERARLIEKRGREGLGEGEEARLAELEGLLEASAAAFLDACEGLREALGGPEGEAAARAAGELRSRQETLAGMGEGTVLVHAVPAPGRLYLMLMTPHALVALESPVGREELGRLAAEFGAAARNPAADPRPAGKRLYDAVFAPLKPELEAAGAKTVMLSLDGALRLVPMPALWDGEKWLAEKYAVSAVSGSTFDKLRRDPPAGPFRAVAFGVTKAAGGAPASPGVAGELSAVVKTSGSAQGALEGEIYLDEDFTRKALSDGLASGAQVAHIASPFLVGPAGPKAAELPLGDGSSLTLRQIRTDPSLDFTGLDLLTLSACDFASEAGAHGREAESFGEVFQRRGASAVLATLWPVSDASTALLMGEFYRLRYAEGKSKAKALREAQLAVMAAGPAGPATAGKAAESEPGAAAGPAAAVNAAETEPSAAAEADPSSVGSEAATEPSAAAEAGPSSAGSEAATESGAQAEAGIIVAPPQAAPAWTGKGFSHPYYWARFFLMGNWR